MLSTTSEKMLEHSTDTPSKSLAWSKQRKRLEKVLSFLFFLYSKSYIIKKEKALKTFCILYPLANRILIST